VPLRNRVTPAGEIVAVPERGTLMGNRGVLHREDGTLVRDWQVRRWIACRLEFKGRRRALLQPRRWTELFFLDEATALAAGHRPCAECRRADYVRWQLAWEAARLGEPRADAMDRVLHADRLGPHGEKGTHRAAAAELPDGVMVALEGAPWRLDGATLHAWTPGGYRARRAAPAGPLEVLTPAATVAVIAAGYVPAIHA
jgi:hypothetical protein